mmetsp:Transcript_32538/g.63701  ORF Transcript_32538/g.63701 Transcript_32538/m.63701 type:complete len:215 (+) Transcript_32538:623-1267(+)
MIMLLADGVSGNVEFPGLLGEVSVLSSSAPPLLLRMLLTQIEPPSDTRIVVSLFELLLNGCSDCTPLPLRARVMALGLSLLHAPSPPSASLCAPEPCRVSRPLLDMLLLLLLPLLRLRNALLPAPMPCPAPLVPRCVRLLSSLPSASPSCPSPSCLLTRYTSIGPCALFKKISYRLLPDSIPSSGCGTSSVVPEGALIAIRVSPWKFGRLRMSS